jgi:hypothetical protein
VGVIPISAKEMPERGFYHVLFNDRVRVVAPGRYNPTGSVSDRASIVATGASVADSVKKARELLIRDEILSVGKRIEAFAIQHNIGCLFESGLFAEEKPPD